MDKGYKLIKSQSMKYAFMYSIFVTANHGKHDICLLETGLVYNAQWIPVASILAKEYCYFYG